MAAAAPPPSPPGLYSQNSALNERGWSDNLQDLVEGVLSTFGLDVAWEKRIRHAMLAAKVTTVQRVVDALSGQPSSQNYPPDDSPSVPMEVPDFMREALYQLAVEQITQRTAGALAGEPVAAVALDPAVGIPTATAAPIGSDAHAAAAPADTAVPVASVPLMRRSPSGHLPCCVGCGVADGAPMLALDCQHLVHRTCLRDHIKAHSTVETLFDARIPCLFGNCSGAAAAAEAAPEVATAAAAPASGDSTSTPETPAAVATATPVEGAPSEESVEATSTAATPASGAGVAVGAGSGSGVAAQAVSVPTGPACDHILSLGELRQCLYSTGDDAYYDEAEAHQIRRMMNTVEVNTEAVTLGCTLCGEELDINSFVWLTRCEHRYCRPCLLSYVEEKTSGRLLPLPKCPGACGTELHPVDMSAIFGAERMEAAEVSHIKRMFGMGGSSVTDESKTAAASPAPAPAATPTPAPATAAAREVSASLPGPDFARLGLPDPDTIEDEELRRTIMALRAQEIARYDERAARALADEEATRRLLAREAEEAKSKEALVALEGEEIKRMLEQERLAAIEAKRQKEIEEKIRRQREAEQAAKMLAEREAAEAEESKRLGVGYKVAVVPGSDEWKRVAGMMRVKIKKLYRIINEPLRLKFENRKNQLHNPSEPTLWLFHGSRSGTDSIIKGGFEMRGRGGLFGRGIYFSSRADKSMAYTGDRRLLVNEVAVGKYKTLTRTDGTLCASKVLPKHDSVWAFRSGRSGSGRADEVIVYNRYQARPIFCVHV